MRLDTTELDMKNAAQVATAGIDAIRAGDSVFDLSAVRTCDSSAVATVLAWQREAEARGVQLQLSGLPAGLISLAKVYGVAPLMNLGVEPGH
jgi:phospholipid transport system transporter-binding protein